MCKKVTIELEDISIVEACHCGRCRRWGNGLLMAVHTQAKLTVHDEDLVIRLPIFGVGRARVLP